MCSRARAIAIRSGVSCPSLGLTWLLLVGCGDSSNEDAGAPKSTATASSATTSGSSAGGSSAGGSSATANGMGAEATSGTGGSAGTGGGSAGTGGSGGSGGTAGAGGAPDTTGTTDTGGTGAGGTGAGGTGGSAGDGVACVPDGAFCRVAPAACPEMQVRAVDGSCWGECVPIGECVCSGPEDCPDEGQYTCHNFSGRCGPYL